VHPVPTAPGRPELTVWSHVWRYALCVAMSAMAWSQVVEGEWQDNRPLLWVDLALGGTAFVLVAFRRRHPMTIAVVTSLMSAVSGVAAGPAVLASVSLATRRVAWELIAIGLLSLTTGQIFVTVAPFEHDDPYWLDLTVNLVATIGFLGWGMYIGSRRELLQALRDQVARAQEDQELKARDARSSERARIAREMHDVLAHRVSLIALHAGGLQLRPDLPPPDVERTAGLIRETARQALEELRGVIGVLRDDNGPDRAPQAPQPTLRDIARLVEDSRSAGANVDLDIRVEQLDTAPGALGRDAYRIVQEALTNVHKHARGTATAVSVTGSPGHGLRVTVSNRLPLSGDPGPSLPGAGMGLVGLSERVTLAGGTLSHGVNANGQFVVAAELRWAE